MSAFYALVCTALGRPPLITKKKRPFQILKDVLYKVMIILFKSVWGNAH